MWHKAAELYVSTNRNHSNRRLIPLPALMTAKGPNTRDLLTADTGANNEKNEVGRADGCMGLKKIMRSDSRGSVKQTREMLHVMGGVSVFLFNSGILLNQEGNGKNTNEG